MPVSINMPTRAPQEQKEDPLDKIAKGLDIAGKLYGIKVNYDTLKLAKEKQKAEIYGEHGIEGGNQVLDAVSGKAPEPAAAPAIDPNAPPPIGAQPQSGPPIGGQPAPAFRGKREIEADKMKTARADDLRKERSGLPTTRATQEIASAYSRMNKVQPTAAGDMSLIYSYMKMLDPGSTVREGEFANAQSAAGFPMQIKGAWERLKSGQRLTPEQRADFRNQAKALYSGQLESQGRADQSYIDLGKKSGIDSKDIIVDFGEGPQAVPKDLMNMSPEDLEKMLIQKKGIGATLKGK